VCDRAHLCGLPCWLCASEGRRLWVFAEEFGRVAGQFCAKKPGRSPSRYPGGLLSDFPFRHYGQYGRKWVTPHVTAPMKRNSGAAMTVLNVGHFAGSGVGNVPERHVDSVCRRAPKRHTVRQGKFSSRAQVFLKGADGYCACDCDVFDTANAICFARSKRKGEKECITERNNRTFRRSWPTT
jgi:hypothetical protein